MRRLTRQRETAWRWLLEGRHGLPRHRRSHRVACEPYGSLIAVFSRSADGLGVTTDQNEMSTWKALVFEVPGERQAVIAILLTQTGFQRAGATRKPSSDYGWPPHWPREAARPELGDVNNPPPPRYPKTLPPVRGGQSPLCWW